MPTARKSVEIQASPEQIMDVLTDFESYPTFLPEIKHTELLETDGQEWEVKFTVDVIRHLDYTLRLIKVSDTVLKWSLVEGVFRSNEGSWELQSLSQCVTLATYDIEIEIGMYVPGNILRSLVDNALGETLHRFKLESERRIDFSPK